MPVPSVPVRLLRNRLENQRCVVVITENDAETENLIEQTVSDYARETGAHYTDRMGDGQMIADSVRYPDQEFVVLVRHWQEYGSRKIVLFFQDILPTVGLLRDELFDNIKVVFYGSNEPMKDSCLKHSLSTYVLKI